MSARLRADDLPGRNPANMNRSLGRPETVSPASAAEAPGKAVTCSPSVMALWTSL